MNPPDLLSRLRRYLIFHLLGWLLRLHYDRRRLVRRLDAQLLLWLLYLNISVTLQAIMRPNDLLLLLLVQNLGVVHLLVQQGLLLLVRLHHHRPRWLRSLLLFMVPICLLHLQMLLLHQRLVQGWRLRALQTLLDLLFRAFVRSLRLVPRSLRNTRRHTANRFRLVLDEDGLLAHLARLRLAIDARHLRNHLHRADGHVVLLDLF